MAFDKTIPNEISEYEIYNVESNDELQKLASSKVDFPEEFEYDPDYFYLWIRIISPGEVFGPNKNGDYFPEEELLGGYETFMDAHVFKNHENKKVEKAIGRIFSVRWNPIMKSVEIFKGIDKKLAPEIVRGFKKGFLTDVSMGCKVPYTVCSVCANKARKQTEFCIHVKNYRMQYLGNGERVFEINYKPKFHDSSVVLNGAERVAKALVIYEEPESSQLVSSFRKAASTSGVSRFVRLTEFEMDKVANYESEVLHPLLRPFKLEKLASENPLMAKIAEMEKEVTGKILNIVSSPHESKPKSAEQLIQIVKFLTEKRMEEDSLHEIGKMLSGIAAAEGVSVSKAFSTFIGVAELMGIELFPTELHTILCSITSCRFEESMKISDADKDEVYPSDFARGVKKTMAATEQLPKMEDPSDLFHAYDEFPSQIDSFRQDPAAFLQRVQLGDDLDEEAPIRVVRVIRETLAPFMGMRSHHPEHLLPRLSVVLGGHRSLRGLPDVAKDVHLMDSPSTFGDMMASIAYSKYQEMRPNLMGSVLVKTAKFYDSDLEKIASSGADSSPKGIKRRTLLMTAVPAIYAASAFQNSRRDNGRNMTDAENFVADNPNVIAGGVLIGGKPLSRGIMKGQQNAREAIGKGYTAAADKVNKGQQGARKAIGKGYKATADKADDITKRAKGGFDKLTFEEYKELVKIADSIDSGDFMAMGEGMMEKFASKYHYTARETAAIKVATLLEFAEMEKEASAILSTSGLPIETTGAFLKEAAAHVDEEMSKAAGEFVNALTLDAMLDRRPISTTVHGRMLDAFVFKKLGDIGQVKQPKQHPEEVVKGVVNNVSERTNHEPKGIQ